MYVVDSHQHSYIVALEFKISVIYIKVNITHQRKDRIYARFTLVFTYTIRSAYEVSFYQSFFFAHTLIFLNTHSDYSAVCISGLGFRFGNRI